MGSPGRKAARFNWERIYRECNGRCATCGKVVTRQEGEMHHILHKGDYPTDTLLDLVDNESFVILLCHPCHQAHHRANTTKQARTQRALLKKKVESGYIDIPIKLKLIDEITRRHEFGAWYNDDDGS